MCRSKAHATVTHHHGGGAVPAAGSEVGVPRCLCVVVRVHVDPARGEQKAVGVDDAVCVCGGGLTSTGDLANDAVFKHDVGDGFGCATAIDESGIADDGLFGICGSHAVSTVVRGGRAGHGRAACGARLGLFGEMTVAAPEDAATKTCLASQCFECTETQQRRHPKMSPLTTVNCPHVPIVSELCTSVRFVLGSRRGESNPYLQNGEIDVLPLDHCGPYEACVHGESENGRTPTQRMHRGSHQSRQFVYSSVPR